MRSGNILLVDDDEMLRPLMAANIRRGGYEVTTAESGKRALELVVQQSFDLILCDIVMGDMEGYEVLDQLLKLQIVPSVPFVFVSGKIDEALIDDARKQGAKGYLKKPVKKKDLMDFLEQILGSNNV